MSTAIAAHPAALEPQPLTPHEPGLGHSPEVPIRHLLCLPILTRSALLINLLLQDGTVDLELVSSVVALDPGLAFTTLQLGNRDRRDQEEVIWQFPLAVVASGQQRLMQAVDQAPKIESYSSTRTRSQLRQIWMRSVVRACVARALSQQLGEANPRQAFLAGLLFELPALVQPTASSRVAMQRALQAASLESLPLELYAAVSQVRDATHNYAHMDDRRLGSLAASLLLAESLLGPTTFRLSVGELSRGGAEELVTNPAWQIWGETTMLQRNRLLDRCCKLARWAAANAPGMNPWEFTARLERSKGWE